MLTSAIGMPNEPGAGGASEGAARKLLEGADPGSLPHEELLAAIDGLTAQKSVDAANVLAKLEQPKDVAKAARRALFRLQTQGIRPSEQPVKEAPAAEPARPATQTVK